MNNKPRKPTNIEADIHLLEARWDRLSFSQHEVESLRAALTADAGDEYTNILSDEEIGQMARETIFALLLLTLLKRRMESKTKYNH
jgi:hypothetical protein